VVKTSLENVRVGLDQLEIYFAARLSCRLLREIGWLSISAADAEAQAAAGHFAQSGRTLLRSKSSGGCAVLMR